MELITKFEQPLLNRLSVVYKITTDGPTTKRLDLVNAIAAKEKGTVVVTHIYPLTGQQASIVHARIYKNDEAAQVEQARMLTKQKAPAAPADASAEGGN
mgnify:CR=1 FL=1